MHIRPLLLFLPLLLLSARTAAQTDSLDVTPDRQLSAASVTGARRAQSLRAASVGHTEVISRTGLMKMACCTVAESFENSASVSVGYSDAVSGARQIRMLGLAGQYTQMLDESRPILRGLGSPFALQYTPGSWLSGIDVSKGVSSVTAGHDAITGQINLNHRKPTDDERLFVNVYADEQMRGELNLASAFHFDPQKNLSSILLLHGAADTEWRMSAMDRNHDGFRDVPRTSELAAANRWLFVAPGGAQLRWGWKLLHDDRLGGSTYFNDNSSCRQAMKNWQVGDGQPLYGSHVGNTGANAYLKVAFPIGRPVGSADAGQQEQDNLAFVADVDHFRTDSYFGRNTYDGRETSAFANLMYLHHFGLSHSLIVGLQSHLSFFRETLLNDVPWATQPVSHTYRLGRNEREAGAYAEYTYKHAERFTAVAGLRADRNTFLGRTAVTPRGQLKWSPWAQTTLRASAGLGFRTANIVADNLGLLATGRTVSIDLTRRQREERALTWGLSLTHRFSLLPHSGTRNATFTADFFQTRFQRSVVIDQELDPAAICIYATQGGTRTNTWQADLNWTALPRLDLTATFRLTDSRLRLIRPDGTTAKAERPLIDKYKGIFNAQFYTPFRRWVFDATLQLNGPSRLPSATGHLGDSRHSPAYLLAFAQVTHKIGLWDVYAGCENLLDYRQRHPVLAADQPFSTAFNTTQVWGPLMGRKIYVGLRFSIF